MDAIGYVRVSTEAQGNEDRFGKEAQREQIAAYARANGYEVREWVEDEVSGVTERREGFDRILFGDTFNPPTEAVIVAKSDRVARDTRLYFYYLYVLERKGIRLISAQEDFGGDESMANVYRALMLFVAEQERRNISLRTSYGRKIKRERGGYAGGMLPYGYRSVGGALVINPEEADMVRSIFNMRRAGLTLRAITEELARLGYVGRSGRPVIISNIECILRRESFYKGLNERTGEKGRQEAII